MLRNFSDRLQLDTGKVSSEKVTSLHSVSKTEAATAPNKIFIKYSWSGYKGVLPDLIIQLYSILIEAKHKLPEKIITNSIPYIIVLTEVQNGSVLRFKYPLV